MSRKLVFAVSALALVAAAPNLAIAKSLKDMIGHDSLVQYCTANGLGEHSVTVTLPSGETVTGTLHCESEDLAGASQEDESSASSAEGEDDASEVEDGSDDSGDGNDNHGDASSGDDENGDDDSGSSGGSGGEGSGGDGGDGEDD